VTKIVISQVYGGGGNSGAPYRNDFIEIFNSGETPVNLAGWSVQYATATASAWSVTTLTSLMLAPGQYYLIQETSGGSNGVFLPTPDTSGTIAMAATAGKVALVNASAPLTGDCQGNSNIVDLVGYGSTASCFRGLGPARAPGNTTSTLRKASGCTDSQDNASDFMAAPPNPRDSGSLFSPCTGAIALETISAEYRNHWRELLALL
jgi:predicted extracellular nuclease